MGAKNKDLELFAGYLSRGVEGIFEERGGVKFSKTPEKSLADIIEYNGKMRADGMEKFNNMPTYVSTINYYLSTADMNKKKAIGAIIVYVQQEFMPRLMRILKYPNVDDESESALLDACGTLCNIIAGRFKSEILKEGYADLEMSHFSTFRNSAVPGIDFCKSEFESYVISFVLENEKRLVLEMSLGIVPKKK